MRRRTYGSLGSLGVTPATDTTPAPSASPGAKLNVPAVLVIVAAIGALVYLTEKDG